MGISRPTLREAIKVLADAGVLAVKSGSSGGTYVATDFIPPGLLQDHSEIRTDEVFGILQARRLLEPRVAQLAGLYASDRDFDVLQQSIEAQRAHLDDRLRFVQLDTRFHLGIARATGNATVIALMRMLLRRIEVARDVAIRVPHEPEHAIELHESTLAAIKTGDPDIIDAAMHEHLLFLENIWEEETGRPFVRRAPEFLVGRTDLAQLVAEPPPGRRRAHTSLGG
jgi:DNA-binding FadR family transcriptional regulator